AIGVYMRAYIAVTGGAAMISFLAILYWQNRNAFQVLRLLLAWCAIICLIWVFLFHGLGGIIHYVTGRFYLSLDNSTAASLYADNNWMLLGLSLMCLFLVPLLH